MDRWLILDRWLDKHYGEYEWIDESMDGWMDGWIDEWMDGWVDGWMNRCMDGWMYMAKGMDWWIDR